jgi:hypothetical protein
LKEWIGVLATPPLNDFDCLFKLGPLITDTFLSFRDKTDLLGKQSAAAVDPFFAVAPRGTERPEPVGSANPTSGIGIPYPAAIR